MARLLINYDYASMSWWERKTQVTATSGVLFRMGHGFHTAFEVAFSGFIGLMRCAVVAVKVLDLIQSLV